MRVRFDPSKLRYNKFFQVGSGNNAPQYFEGLPVYFQKGHGYYRNQSGAGIGDVFRRLWRFLKFVVANAGRALGEERLATSARILNNVVDGGNIKDALQSEGKEGLRNLLLKAEHKLASQRGQGRKRKNKNTVVLKPEDFIGKSVLKKSVKNKKLRIDALGQF
jgi:hypothetical protein